MRWLHWLTHSWQHVRRMGAWHYQQCRVCGARQAIQQSGVIGPQDRQWLAGGEWNTRRPVPPRCR